MSFQAQACIHCVCMSESKVSAYAAPGYEAKVGSVLKLICWS